MYLTPRRLFFVFSLLFCSALLVMPSPSCAGSAPSGSATAGATSSCDPKFMEALRQRAYMEAQREVVTNAATIWKPDSVMQLTCFDAQLGGVMKTTGAGFSEKQSQDEQDINLNSGKADTQFDKYVMAGALQVAQKQVNGNFTAQLAGGNPSVSGLDYIVGINNDGTPSSASQIEGLSSQPCNNMRKVWNAARCANIDPDKAFVSLPLFAKGQDESGQPLNDPRNGGVIQNIAAGAGDTVDCASQGYDVAGLSAASQLLDTPGVGSSAFTPASLFAAVTAPYSQLKNASGAQGSCFPGIKTGVMLGNNVEEVVCPNPGCIPQDGTCKPQS